MLNPFVIVAAVPVLAPAGGPAPFTEEAVARGIDYATVERLNIHGYGVALVDLDHDGDPDAITLGRADGVVGVYENNGNGVFADRSGQGIPDLDSPSGVVALDHDADGDLDLYFTQFDAANVLTLNKGGFEFADVTATARVGDAGPGNGATAGDVDGDGRVDLYVTNYGSADRYYKNLGNGRFHERAAALGLDDPWLGFQGVFFDRDWDGDADLYVSNDSRMPGIKNRLYDNQGGTLVDISDGSGADVAIYSMGVAVGCFDGDRRQDLYCTNLGTDANALLIAQPDGTYLSQEAAAGVDSYRTGWGAAFFDYDHDTGADLYVCNSLPHASAANRLYTAGTSSWPCVDMAPTLAVDDAENSYGVAVGDVDGDGDLDLLVQSTGAKVRLYINQEGTSRNWVKFEVVGTGYNRFAVGARVAIRAGGKWQDREVLAGGNGYKGMNDLPVHFGLGSSSWIDEVVVTWPGGTTHRRLVGLAANRTWRIRPPARSAPGTRSFR